MLLGELACFCLWAVSFFTFTVLFQASPGLRLPALPCCRAATRPPGGTGCRAGLSVGCRALCDANHGWTRLLPSIMLSRCLLPAHTG